MIENPKQSVSDTKPQLQLISPAAEIAEAEALAYGAFKSPRADGGFGYGPWNWRDDAIKLTTYIGAMHRHLNAIKRGEDIDPKSGLSHIAHIRANTGIVLDAASMEMLIDDRPKRREVHQTTQVNPGDPEDDTPTETSIEPSSDIVELAASRLDGTAHGVTRPTDEPQHTHWRFMSP